ncbi:hypothetical protein HHK36_025104 [Tetracentron sinense]|uniref:Uncharacterized protein n=1 Tax=Tetracentron sinense TaxID=13715 RepID=A0A834YR90_TETSI|nr:hypothetical protein HHK36_025104 [Tetracentron sinense]
MNFSNEVGFSGDISGFGGVPGSQHWWVWIRSNPGSSMEDPHLVFCGVLPELLRLADGGASSIASRRPITRFLSCTDEDKKRYRGDEPDSYSRGTLQSINQYLVGCDNILVQLHTKHPQLCDKVGGLLAMHIDNLWALAPLWLSKTEEVQEDRAHWATNITGDIHGKGWISEMYGIWILIWCCRTHILEYPAINKPAAVLHWLNHANIDAEFIVILDADMILRGPITPWEFKAARGRPVSTPYDYLLGCDNEFAKLHTRHPDACDKVGGVIIMHIDDLSEMNLRHLINNEILIYPDYVPEPKVKYRVFHYGLEFSVGKWSFDKAN